MSNIYLYHLIHSNDVYYVGLTKNPNQRKRAHLNSKPNHQFEIISEYVNATEASIAEHYYIQKHHTYNDKNKWNKDPGGNYDKSSGFKRKGIGGRKPGSIPWNKGLNSKTDDRVKNNSMKSAKTKRKQGFYDDCSKYLKSFPGDSNPMKKEENREKLRKIATGRFRVYRDDGTWTWGYPD